MLLNVPHTHTHTHTHTYVTCNTDALFNVYSVDQLQGYKKMSENMFRDTLDFSALNVSL